jgi:hypothetical protein
MVPTMAVMVVPELRLLLLEVQFIILEEVAEVLTQVMDLVMLILLLETIRQEEMVAQAVMATDMLEDAAVVAAVQPVVVIPVEMEVEVMLHLKC